jgi:hypothetical protein
MSVAIKEYVDDVDDIHDQFDQSIHQVISHETLLTLSALSISRHI